MLAFQKDFAHESVIAAARAMADCARTAPKAVGQDGLEIAVIDGADKAALAEHMRVLCRDGRAGAHFLRDADNLDAAQACLLIGTLIAPDAARDCAGCGVLECANRNGSVGTPCSFRTHDLGLAVGSAVSMAADLRIDNRVMFSVGVAAVDLALLGERVRLCMGIPLSVSRKNPFFDRK